MAPLSHDADDHLGYLKAIEIFIPQEVQNILFIFHRRTGNYIRAIISTIS